MPDPRRPRATAAESAALRVAVESWKLPANFTGVQLLPATAQLAASNPILSAAFLDASQNSALAKTVQAMGAGEAARLTSMPTLLGSSLAAQAARSSLGRCLDQIDHLSYPKREPAGVHRRDIVAA